MTTPELTRVSIRDIDVPFVDLMVLLVKVAVAMVPAGVIVTMIYLALAGFVAGVVAAL